MSETEFEIIRRYFTRQPVSREEVLTGIGDDAAVVRPPSDRELLLCIDTLVAGVHFPLATPAAAIGHKALAVNLSDLAAMGAEPVWATLALTLPEPDPGWLEAFSDGFFALAGRYGVQLIGGDTTRGPLTVTVQAHGVSPPGQVLHRAGALPGDRIYVTGTLGDAALALRIPGAVPEDLRRRLDFPEPRIEAGRQLRALASAAIDVSDGLLADLDHILEASRLGARIEFSALPVSPALRNHLQHPAAKQCTLSGGDDYELCFTAPVARHDEILDIAARLELPLTAIGTVVTGRGCLVLDTAGNPINMESSGYDHFR